jgi:hypothetical protein
VVGGRYRNAAGEYEVLALAEGKARIRYANGLEMTLPAGGLWAQWEALIAEAAPRPAPAARPAATRAAPSRATSTGTGTTTRTPARAVEPKAARGKKATGEAGFYVAAGYLAGGCEIVASVPGRNYVSFAQRYQIATGRGLSTPHPGLDVHERPTHSSTWECSVRFPATPSVLAQFDFGAKVKVEATDGGWYRASGGREMNELVERLFRLGFDLGPNTNPLVIRQKVEPDQLGHFDRGMSLRRTVRA